MSKIASYLGVAGDIAGVKGLNSIPIDDNWINIF